MKKIKLCLVLMIVFMVGCVPLKKKFTRQKKKDKMESEKFKPVLDPIDYPQTALVSPKKQYAHYYNLWKVWYKDLTGIINHKNNEKRQKYLTRQMEAQLVEMKVWVIDEKVIEIDKNLKSLKNVLREYDKPPAIRDNGKIKRGLARVAPRAGDRESVFRRWSRFTR